MKKDQRSWLFIGTTRSSIYSLTNFRIPHAASIDFFVYSPTGGVRKKAIRFLLWVTQCNRFIAFATQMYRSSASVGKTACQTWAFNPFDCGRIFAPAVGLLTGTTICLGGYSLKALFQNLGPYPSPQRLRKKPIPTPWAMHLPYSFMDSQTNSLKPRRLPIMCRHCSSSITQKRNIASASYAEHVRTCRTYSERCRPQTLPIPVPISTPFPSHRLSLT